MNLMASNGPASMEKLAGISGNLYASRKETLGSRPAASTKISIAQFFKNATVLDNLNPPPLFLIAPAPHQIDLIPQNLPKKRYQRGLTGPLCAVRT
jgi:hypothetical protein